MLENYCTKFGKSQANGSKNKRTAFYTNTTSLTLTFNLATQKSIDAMSKFKHVGQRNDHFVLTHCANIVSQRWDNKVFYLADIGPTYVCYRSIWDLVLHYCAKFRVVFSHEANLRHRLSLHRHPHWSEI